ncbi:hypothetical protein ACHAXA_006536 [Cyclostephanos tholiformis]|uniref:Uncharacterized protein n=1 Tax=Cyclostephanos tholiformis TaxID=382380 RepID=A0ABD3RBA9_9STRA
MVISNPRSISTKARKGVDVVLKAVDHFGDNSKTLECLWMTVNRVSYVDPTFDRCCGALEWLSGADTYRSHRSNVAMNNGAEHQSMQKYYIPTGAAAVHLLCCVETRPDLTFSTRPLSNCHYQNQANVSLVHRFRCSYSSGCGLTSTRRHSSRTFCRTSEQRIVSADQDYVSRRLPFQ